MRKYLLALIVTTSVCSITFADEKYEIQISELISGTTQYNLTKTIPYVAKADPYGQVVFKITQKYKEFSYEIQVEKYVGDQPRDGHIKLTDNLNAIAVRSHSWGVFKDPVDNPYDTLTAELERSDKLVPSDKIKKLAITMIRSE